MILVTKGAVHGCPMMKLTLYRHNTVHRQYPHSWQGCVQALYCTVHLYRGQSPSPPPSQHSINIFSADGPDTSWSLLYPGTLTNITDDISNCNILPFWGPLTSWNLRYIDYKNNQTITFSSRFLDKDKNIIHSVVVGYNQNIVNNNGSY